MLGDSLVLLYCAVIGFVASGVAASFFKMMTSKPARFGMLGEGTLAMIATYAFVGVSGPMIIVDMALAELTPRSNKLAWLAGGALIAILWSACSGLILIDVVLSIRGGI
jgi:hypothetical protein